MMRIARQVLLFIVVGGVVACGAWAILRANALKRQALRQASNTSNLAGADIDLWTRGIEKVNEDRSETGGGAIEIPPELRHYSDRHWFLATHKPQVGVRPAILRFSISPYPGNSDMATDMPMRGKSRLAEAHPRRKIPKLASVVLRVV